MRILKTLSKLGVTLSIIANLSGVSATEQVNKPVSISIADTKLQTLSQKDLLLLSLDGGGSRSAIQIAQLAHLEEITGKRCYEVFDVFAGSSTGGIIAGLFALGLPAKDILNLYIKNGPDVFKKDFTNTWNYSGWFTTQFSRNNLDDILSTLTQRMDGSPIMFNSTDGSLKKRLLVTGYNLIDQKILMLDSDDKNVQENTLAQILALTSAAPNYLDPTKIHYDGKEILGIDGGLYVNDPAYQVYIMLVNEYIAKEREQFSGQGINLQIFSFGTGKVVCPKNEKDLPNKYFSPTLEPMLAALFNSSAVIQENNIRMQLKKDKSDRARAKPMFSKELPGFFIDHYFRSQADLVDKATHIPSATDHETICKLYDIGRMLTESKLLEMLDVLFPGRYSQDDVKAAMVTVENNLWKIDAYRQPCERVSDRDKIYFHQLINGYVYQEDELARTKYFSNLMYNDKELIINGVLNVSKLSNEEILDLNDWVMTFMKFNMLHDLDKSITSKAKYAITNYTIGKIAGYCRYAYYSGKHQELAAKLKMFYTILQKEILDKGIGGLIDSNAHLTESVAQAEVSLQLIKGRIMQKKVIDFVIMHPTVYQLTPEAFELLNNREVKLIDLQLEILSRNHSLTSVNENVPHSRENEILKDLFLNFIDYCGVDSLTSTDPDSLVENAVAYWGKVFGLLDPSVYKPYVFQKGNFQKNIDQAISDIKASRYGTLKWLASYVISTNVSRYYVLGDALEKFVMES